MSDRIKEVKEKTNIIAVAEYFNINLNNGNKAICPFHEENTASFSIEERKQIWHCFGCNKGGDVIDLVGHFRGTKPLDSAKIINDIFCLDVDFGTKVNKEENKEYQIEQKQKEDFKMWKSKTYIKLCNRFHILDNKLKNWKLIDIENNINWNYAKEMVELEILIDIFINYDKDILDYKNYIDKVVNKWNI